ncbi:hypothetical protein [Persephonella sp.]
MLKSKKIILSLVAPFFFLILGSCGDESYENRYIYDDQDRLYQEKYETPSEDKRVEYMYDSNGNIITVRMN